MGQQQLLLVILVTILVGIATVVAINVFGTAAEQGNRDAVRQDLLQAAAGAQAIWTRPEQLGGAGGDFGNLDDDELFSFLGIPGSLNAAGDALTNENAVYTIVSAAGNTLIMQAVPASWQNFVSLEVERRDNPAAGEDRWRVAIDDGLADPVPAPTPL